MTFENQDGDNWIFSIIVLSEKDKILQSSGRDNGIQVTNDGATILKSIGVDNPAAKVLVGESLLLIMTWQNFLHV